MVKVWLGSSTKNTWLGLDENHGWSENEHLKRCVGKNY